MGHWPSSIGHWLLSLAVACTLLLAPAARAQDAELEYKVKAAFLYNFISFVEWPAGKLAAKDTDVVVGCLPDDPAAPVLARALEGKTVEGRRIKLVVFKDTDDFRDCHLLFIGRARKDKVDDVLARLKQMPVLTVSEIDQFAQRGGMINFVRHERTFRFEINLGAAERSGLRISSKLASMATIIKTAPSP
jgi:hypothetical protein